MGIVGVPKESTCNSISSRAFKRIADAGSVAFVVRTNSSISDSDDRDESVTISSSESSLQVGSKVDATRLLSEVGHRGTSSRLGPVGLPV